MFYVTPIQLERVKTEFSQWERVSNPWFSILDEKEGTIVKIEAGHPNVHASSSTTLFLLTKSSGSRVSDLCQATLFAKEDTPKLLTCSPSIWTKAPRPLMELIAQNQQREKRKQSMLGKHKQTVASMVHYQILWDERLVFTVTNGKRHPTPSFKLRRWDEAKAANYVSATKRLIASALSQRQGLSMKSRTGFEEFYVWSQPSPVPLHEFHVYKASQKNIFVEAMKAYLMTLHFLIENALKTLDQHPAEHDLNILFRNTQLPNASEAQEKLAFFSYYCMGGRYDNIEEMQNEPVIKFSTNPKINGMRICELDDFDDARNFMHECSAIAVDLVRTCAGSLLDFTPHTNRPLVIFRRIMDTMGYMTMSADQLCNSDEAMNLPPWLSWSDWQSFVQEHLKEKREFFLNNRAFASRLISNSLNKMLFRLDQTNPSSRLIKIGTTVQSIAIEAFRKNFKY